MTFLKQLWRLLFYRKSSYTANIVYQGQIVGCVYCEGRIKNIFEATEMLFKVKGSRGSICDLRKLT